MDLQTFFNATLFINLFSCILNVAFYSIGYVRVNSSKVDGTLIRIKRVILLELFIVFFAALLFGIVFATVIFVSKYTNTALYLLNFALLFFNIGFNINAALLAWIVEGNKSYEGN